MTPEIADAARVAREALTLAPAGDLCVHETLRFQMTTEPMGFLVSADQERPLAWLAPPDSATWRSVAATADECWDLAPARGRRPPDLVAMQDGVEQARYRPGALVWSGPFQVGEQRLRLRAATLWRSAWELRAGRQRWARLLVLSRTDDHLTFYWRAPTGRHPLVPLMLAYCVLNDDAVSRVFPPTTAGAGTW